MKFISARSWQRAGSAAQRRKAIQNILSATYLIQLQGKQYVSVWPADRATAKLDLPMKGWH